MLSVEAELRRRLRRTFLLAGIPVLLAGAVLVTLAAYDAESTALWLALVLLGLAVPCCYLLAVRTLQTMVPLYESLERLTEGLPLRDEAPDSPQGPTLQATVRRATARLQRIEQAVLDRSEFIASASHELRTPVTSLGVLLESLQAGAKDDIALRDAFLRDMQREVERLQLLVHDLLDVAKYEAGPAGLIKERVDMAGVIGDTLAGLEPLAQQRQVTLRQEVPASLPPLAGDPLALSRMLANLAANAIKFTPAGGQVTVRARVRPAELELQVQDTGSGIPADALPHIFKRFYTVDRAHTRGQGGSGLGLAIAQQIVRAHGGTIRVESELGKGTTVNVSLPVEDRATRTGPIPASPTPPIPSPSK